MVDCIDKNLAQDQIEDRIHKFIYRRMDEDELTEFIAHLHECKACDKESDVMAKISRGFELYFTYEEFLKAYENHDWLSVLRLGEKMKIMVNPEGIYPIRKKISDSQLKLASGLMICVGGNDQQRMRLKKQTQRTNLEMIFAKEMDEAQDIFRQINYKMYAVVVSTSTHNHLFYTIKSGFQFSEDLEGDIHVILAYCPFLSHQAYKFHYNDLEKLKKAKDNVIYLEKPEEIKEFMENIVDRFAA